MLGIPNFFEQTVPHIFQIEIFWGSNKEKTGSKTAWLASHLRSVVHKTDHRVFSRFTFTTVQFLNSTVAK